MYSRFPACYIELTENTEYRRAPFYLAAEEYVARNFPGDTYLFSWQLNPTVVMGRNQVAHQEFNLDFCREHGIDVVRRKSGGGAIFADRNNIMWSLITDEGAVEPIFMEYAHYMAYALGQLGVDTEVSGRNDILIRNGGKICGNAFYHLPHRNIVHGTMLFDTNMNFMQGALHPDHAKLETKGIKSVRSRVSFLKDYLSFDVIELRKRLRDLLCDRCITLSDADVKAIEELEQEYYSPEYLYGLSAKSDLDFSGRIEGCGTLGIHLKLHGTLIESVRLSGDFFELDNALQRFNEAFTGIPYTPQSLNQAIDAAHPEKSIRNLSAENLKRLFRPNSEKQD